MLLVRLVIGNDLSSVHGDQTAGAACVGVCILETWRGNLVFLCTQRCNIVQSGVVARFEHVSDTFLDKP